MVRYFVRTESVKSLDFYPTPPWATRALFEKILFIHTPKEFWNHDMTCLEPACGQGHMARAMKPYFCGVDAYDINDYGYGLGVQNFLKRPDDGSIKIYDWVITNPPFAKEMPAKFVLKARSVASKGIAIFARCHLIEGKWRYDHLFSKFPPVIIAPFVERVTLIKNRVTRRSNSVTPYAWFIWDVQKISHYGNFPKIIWIPPCKKELERNEDYGTIDTN